MIMRMPAHAAGLAWTQAQGAERHERRAWVEPPCLRTTLGPSHLWQGFAPSTAERHLE
jgi:hypothetical protein